MSRVIAQATLRKTDPFLVNNPKHPKHGDVYRIDPDAIDAVYGGFQR